MDDRWLCELLYQIIGLKDGYGKVKVTWSCSLTRTKNNLALILDEHEEGLQICKVSVLNMYFFTVILILQSCKLVKRAK